MTRRSRKKTGRKNRRMGRRTFLLGAGAAVCAAAGLALRRGTSPAAADSTPEPSADPNPALPAGEWRAVWVSYLEWAAMDFSTEDAFRAGVVQLLDNCAGLGLNTVLAQVRPFGDALYRSTLFPWSHLCTGVQGQDPGFDPLDVLLQEAHTRGISVEAWVNPYRLRSSAAMPPNLADGNLANTHPEWVCTVDEGLYLNPAVSAAADYVVQGVAELVQNYAVDGIAFENIVPAWLAYPRAADVALYFGLGAYRVGVGDGGSNENSLSGWSTGRALADQVAFLREQGAGGWALYRYGSLFGPEQTSLAAAECGALAAADGKESA